MPLPLSPAGGTVLPPGGCQLLWQATAEQSSGVVVYGHGAALLSSAQVPLRAGNVTGVPGYSVLPGRSFLNRYNVSTMCERGCPPCGPELAAWHACAVQLCRPAWRLAGVHVFGPACNCPQPQRQP